MQIWTFIGLLCLLSCVPMTITLPDKTDANYADFPQDISLWVDGRACIDERKKNIYDGCAMIADPVCGCDGYMYGNSCEAKNNGVLFFLDKEVCSE